MAGPNVGQSSGAASAGKEAAEEIKTITDLTEKKEKTIFDMLFSIKENGDKKKDEQWDKGKRFQIYYRCFVWY